MTIPTPSDVDVIVLDLDKVATRAESIATTLRDTANDLERTIDGLNWSGEGRKGAERRASSEKQQMRTLATAFEDLATGCRTAQAAMAPTLDKLRSLLTWLRGSSFEVDNDWNVTDKLNYKAAFDQAGDDQSKKDQLTQYQTDRSNTAANATVELKALAAGYGLDDDKCAAAINKAVYDMGILAPASAGLSPKLADSDVAALKNGRATPDQVARLKAATHLTDQQLDDLLHGKQVNVPQGQFDYVREVMRDLDGSSIDEMSKLGDTLPYTERQDVQSSIVDAMQMMSNPQIGTTGGGADRQPAISPDHGGMAMLPTQVRTLLTQAPTRWDEKHNQSEFAGKLIEIPREGDFNTLAEMLHNGNPALAQGSDLDRGLLKQASEIAGLGQGTIVVSSDGSSHSANPIADKMLTAAGGDRLAVHDLLYGTNMDCTVTEGHYDAESHVANLLNHSWNGHDDGIAKVIETAGHDATSADPTVNRQSGEASWALANYVSTHSNELLHLGGGDQSIGVLDPNMTKALGSTLGAYIPDMVGADEGMFGTHGFGAIDQSHVKDIFAVIDSNKDAATDFNRAAYASIAQMNQQFGSTGGTDYSLGEFAGRIDAAAQAGVKLEVEGRIHDAKAQADEEKLIFDSVKDIAPFGAKHIPRLLGLSEKWAGFTVSDFTELGTKMATPGVKEWMFGSVPDLGANADLSGYGSYAKQYYNILQGMTLTPDHPNYSQDPNIGKYFDSAGNLLSFDAIKGLDGARGGANSLVDFNGQMKKFLPGLVAYDDGWRAGHDESGLHPR
ncbi:TPR repeat region-containing protein [Nocardia niigatensis]